MDLLLGIVIGMIVAVILVYIWLQMTIRRATQNIDNLLHVIERLQQNVFQARVEEENGVFYVYNTEDQSFMAQGTTVDELRERIEQRWKDAQVFITQGDQAVLQRLRATGGETKLVQD